MSFEEEFDKIIRQKTDEAGFPFDEKNWEKVSRQLDLERKGAGFMAARKVYVAAALLVLLSSVGVFIYRGTMTGDEPLADNTVARQASEEQIRDIQVAQQNQTSEKVQIQEALPVSQNNQKTSTSEIVLSTETSASISKKEKVSVKLNKKPEPSENSSAKTSAPVAAINNDQAIVSKTPAEPTANNDHVAKTESVPVETPLPEKVVENKDLVVAAKEIPEIFQPEQLAAINTSLPTDTEEKDILPTQFSMLKFYDQEYYKNKKNKTHFLNLEAGTTYLMGWQTKNGIDGKGLNWYGGINYGLYLSRKVNVGLGVQLYNITNIDQAFYSHTKTEYGFSSVNSHTFITARSLYYVSVPLKFSYAVNPQNQLGLGLNVGYLINANNNIETYNTSVEHGKTESSNSKKTGVYEGMASTNLLLSAFYKTQLTKRLALNGEFVYGLTDLFNNTTTIKNTENATGFRLSLQYTLFDK